MGQVRTGPQYLAWSLHSLSMDGQVCTCPQCLHSLCIVSHSQGHLQPPHLARETWRVRVLTHARPLRACSHFCYRAATGIPISGGPATGASRISVPGHTGTPAPPECRLCMPNVPCAAVLCYSVCYTTTPVAERLRRVVEVRSVSAYASCMHPHTCTSCAAHACLCLTGFRRGGWRCTGEQPSAAAKRWPPRRLLQLGQAARTRAPGTQTAQARAARTRAQTARARLRVRGLQQGNIRSYAHRRRRWAAALICMFTSTFLHACVF
eukprot:gene24079-biopygen11880